MLPAIAYPIPVLFLSILVLILPSSYGADSPIRWQSKLRSSYLLSTSCRSLPCLGCHDRAPISYDVILSPNTDAIPLGNVYTIANISQRDAYIFFAQSRKVLDDSEEPSPLPRDVGPSGEGKKTKAKVVEARR
jgi:hypothetical protein